MDTSQTAPNPHFAAAVEVFAERGYLGTSVNDLGQAMALDAAAFRGRFTDKQGCFLAAYDSVIVVANAGLSDAFVAEAPWAARLADVLRHLLELIDANTAAARLVLIESQFAGEAALRRYMATLKNVAVFMRGGRRYATAVEHPPPILDSVLPAGVALDLRHRLLRGEQVAPFYRELLALLLLPYLGEAASAACLADSPFLPTRRHLDRGSDLSPLEAAERKGSP
jgi:AcrR family transcriptional regulator